MKRPDEVMEGFTETTESRLKEGTVDDGRERLSRGDLSSGSTETLEAIPRSFPAGFPSFPIPIPWFVQASGLYEWKWAIPFPIPFPQPVPIPGPIPIQPGPFQPGAVDGDGQAEAPEATAALTPIFFLNEELRLDVDGRYPQMVASGTLRSGLSVQVHWIANLAASGSNTYTGSIWYKDGSTATFPYTNLKIQVVKSIFSSYRKATVTFSGGGAFTRVRTYKWKSSYFHPDELEYDVVSGTTAVTSINTGAHPNRPPALPVEGLSIETVYRRAGFDVSMSGGNSTIPLSVAGPDALWSDMEMHDAMQVYWSRFANKPQWSVWTLFAGQHVAVPSRSITPTNLGGIMFDDIGPNHRQGTAIFNGSFIKNPPPGDPNPAAAVQRMKFWTACHELGHTFNLAHSWQKSHPPSWGTPWIPIPNEPEARSFMNYPYNVTGGESAFFADFEYRFSDGELLFMRHAPSRFVQHGNADWFDNHGFQQANVSPAPSLALELRVHRTQEYFEFLEPVTIELKLTNITSQPMVVDETILSNTDEMTVIVKKQGKTARQWSPYARHCYRGTRRVLNPGESMYGSLFIASGLNGWDVAEPGIYGVQAVLHHDREDILSKPLRIRVAPPRGYDEEFVAQDLFSEDVGRTLAFHGTRSLARANDTLQEVVERCSDRRVATHARLALGSPLTRTYKLLQFKTDRAGAEAKHIDALRPEPETAREQLSEVLLDDPTTAADTLGHIDYTQMVTDYTAFLAAAGERTEAVEGLQRVEKTLAGRGVLASVVDELAQRRKACGGQETRKKKPKNKKD